jgi:alpha-N-arabinofuranosidase
VQRFPQLVLDETHLLAGDDLEASNTEAEPDRVRPTRLSRAALDDGCLRFELPAVSWAALSLTSPLREPDHGSPD